MQGELDRYVASIGGFPPLVLREEQALYPALKLTRGKRKEQAQQKLIVHNLRLVIYLANQFRNKGLGLPDLVAEGNQGLIRAVKGYDPHRKVKFSSYAAWWIKQFIRLALARQTRAVRLPRNVMVQLGRCSQAQKDFEAKQHRLPTELELADILNIPVNRLVRILEAGKVARSLQSPMQGDDALTLEQTLPDTQPNPADTLCNKTSREHLWSTMRRTLTQREQDIVARRFGMGNHAECTLEHISKTYHCTRERIRQIEYKALRTLRKNLARN